MEFVDRFDNKRRPLNKVTERYDNKPGEYKLAIHIWIMNDKGEYLIQKRSMLKKVFPGVWSTTAGGTECGENTLETAIRESKEELGIDVDIDKLQYLMMLKRENNFLDVFLLKDNIAIEDLVLQPEEVDDAKWVSVEEIRNLINNNEFSDSASYYFEMLIKEIEMFAE